VHFQVFPCRDDSVGWLFWCHIFHD
jgi:hypothetical protein